MSENKTGENKKDKIRHLRLRWYHRGPMTTPKDLVGVHLVHLVRYLYPARATTSSCLEEQPDCSFSPILFSDTNVTSPRIPPARAPIGRTARLQPPSPVCCRAMALLRHTAPPPDSGRERRPDVRDKHPQVGQERPFPACAHARTLLGILPFPFSDAISPLTVIGPIHMGSHVQLRGDKNLAQT